MFPRSFSILAVIKQFYCQGKAARVSVKEDNAPILILSLACGKFQLHKERKHGSKLKKESLQS